MSSVQEKKFLRLFKFSLDLSSKVCRAFTKSNILTNHNDSFSDYLKTHKHNIYHLYQVINPCCSCGVASALSPRRLLFKEQFDKLFSMKGMTNPSHVKKNKHNNNIVAQHCICNVTVNSSCCLKDLDVTLLYTLIKNLEKSLQHQDGVSLTVIKDVRNRLAHAESTTDIKSHELDTLWTKLENSVLDLATRVSEDYRDIIEDLISYLKVKEFDETIRQEINKEHDKLKQELEMLEERVSARRIEDLKVVKESSENVSSSITDLQETYEKGNKNLDQRLLDLQQEQSRQIGAVDGKLEQILIFLQASVGNNKKHSRSKETNENRTVDAECQVDGDDFDHEKAVKELPNREGTGGELDKFDIKKATIGSLLLDLSASPDVLKNPETLKAAIKDLTERIIKAGNVDTSVPGKLNIKLIFRSPLTQDELQVIQTVFSNSNDNTEKPPAEDGKINMEIDECVTQGKVSSEDELQLTQREFSTSNENTEKPLAVDGNSNMEIEECDTQVKVSSEDKQTWLTRQQTQNTMATGGSTDQMNFTLLDMVDHLENLAKPDENDLRQNKYCEYITLLLSHFGMERYIVTGSTQENTRLRRKENEGDFDYLMISGITIPSDCLEYKEYLPNFVKINGISLKDKFPDVELLDAKYLPCDLLSDMRPEAFKHMKAIYEFVSQALSKTTRGINTLRVAFESRTKPGISVTHYLDPICIHPDIGKEDQGKNYEAIMQNVEQCLKDESPEIKSMTYSTIKAVGRVVDAYEQIDPDQHDTESNLKQTFGPLFGPTDLSTKETFESIIVEDKHSTSNMNNLERKFESQQIASDSVMVQTEEECLSSANMNFDSDTNPTQTGSTPIAENRSEGEVLIQYCRKSCRNFIPVFPLLGKPKYLDEWKTRKRTSEWPPLHVIAEIYQSEFFVVAKPAINHPETDRDFCLAYNLAEIKLAKAMTGVQRSVMLIIKAFQTTVLQQFSEELTTYHWKTAVYKVSESADKSVIENKTEENILGFLQDILVFMTNSLCENYLEHYFVPSNLFALKVKEKMLEIASNVAEIQKNPLEKLRDFFVQEEVSGLKYDIVSKNKIKEFHENYTDSGEHGLVRSIISLVKSFANEEREYVRDAFKDVLTQALPFFIKEEARGRERQNVDDNSPFIQFLLGSEFVRDTMVDSCVSLLLNQMTCEHEEVVVQEIAQDFFSLVMQKVLFGNN